MRQAKNVFEHAQNVHSDHPAHAHAQSITPAFARHSTTLSRGDNLGVILVRVCEPVFQNLPHSYTWPSKRRPIHI